MRHRSRGWRGQSCVWLVACVAALTLIAGCSGSANPINRLKARVQLKEGNLSYMDGEYKDAIQSYDRALRYVPELAPAHLNRAFSQEALSRTTRNVEERQRLATEAVDSFEKYLGLVEHGGISIDPKAPDRERIEGHILTLLVDSQQVDQAIAHLQARYEKNPRDASALEMLSRLEMDRGRVEEAMGWQRKRVEADPDNPDARYSLGAYLWLISYRDHGIEPAQRTAMLDEGLASLERALELRPDDFETLIYINLLYIEKAKYSDNDADRARYEAQARAHRERGLALRAAAQKDSSAAPADSTPESSLPAAQSSSAPDSTQKGPESP